MSRTRQVVRASPEQVWGVLADGWLYAGWVVGATHMRSVDADWPGAGSSVHHSFGSWPLLIEDQTEVIAAEPPLHLTLRARGWPLGEAEITLRLRPTGPSTEVEIEEDAVAGPGRWVPRLLRAPLIDLRNREALRRLAHLAENRP